MTANQDFLHSILLSSVERTVPLGAKIKILTIESLSASQDSDKFNEDVRKQKYATNQTNQLLGLHPYQVTYQLDNREYSFEFMLKGYSDKGVDAELLPAVLKQSHLQLSKPLSHYLWGKEFGPSAWREINFYDLQTTYPLLTQYTPRYFGHYQNSGGTNIVLVQEYLTNTLLLNEVADITVWTHNIILTAITGIAAIHSCSYENPALLMDPKWKSTQNTLEEMTGSIELWNKLAEFIRLTYPNLVSEKDYQFHLKIINTLSQWYSESLKLPHALIQNDFNPRNICFRQKHEELTLCAYDWERTEVNLPQHDLAEFLIFTLSDKLSNEQIMKFIDHHRLTLEQRAQKTIDKEQWEYGLGLSLFDLHINRIPFLLLFNNVFVSQFALRLFANLKRLLALNLA